MPRPKLAPHSSLLVRGAVASSILVASLPMPAAVEDIKDFTAAPHDYWTRPLKDRFSVLFEKIKSGAVKLDESSPKNYLASLLRVLEVPVSSQLLVFSFTSLETRFIPPRNPRALYFNEDTYVSFAPGGNIEVLSIDSELGGILYIYPVPRAGEPPRVDRSNRCFNCHAGSFSHRVPGLFVESVIPGENGAPLDAYRREMSGHGVPFDQRHGGWHVTGDLRLASKGNILGRLFKGELTTWPNPPGTLFDLKKYLVPTSDILPHLLHEHQVGFTNRVIEAVYQTRARLDAGGGRLSSADGAVLDEFAAGLVRYVLFADEAPLPAPVTADRAFAGEFLRRKRAAADGKSLRDLDLRTRLFRHRCSYMIYSSHWNAMPPVFRERVYAKLWDALQERAAGEYGYLPASEKRDIRRIIKATMTGLPPSWD